MKLLFLFSIILLPVFPIYPDDNKIAEQSENIDFFQEELGEDDAKIAEDKESNIPPYVYSPYKLYGLWGNIAYSDSGLESKNFTVGLNFSIFKAPPGGMIILYTIQTFGADYQYHSNKNGPESIFRMNYTLSGYFAVFGAGGGISTFYNISNNDIGITPQIGGSLFVGGYIIINYYYRYNIVLNNIKHNYHETIVSVNIGHWSIWGWK
jgi:hypothetical protein